MTEAKDAQEFERRFRERATEYLIGDELHIDHRNQTECWGTHRVLGVVPGG